MANEFVIKEKRFPSVTYSGGMTAAGSTLAFTDMQVNGALLDVQWTASIIGSLTLTASGTGIVLWQNKAPSGAGWQVVHPAILNQLSTGSIAGGFLDTYYLNEPLRLQYDIGSNALANMSGLSYQVNVRYQ